MLSSFNMNFDQRIVINTNLVDWMKSPARDVMRIPLERESAESGHTTSVVKYLAGANFKEHEHPNGEEILVLEGVFSDENGHYPAGSYVRNPPGTKHAPFSKEGCTLFVKLNQFAQDDLTSVLVNTTTQAWLPGQGGLMVMPLHNHLNIGTALVKWPAGEKFQAHRHMGGEEIYVISGEFIDEHGRYPAGTWLRNPHYSTHLPFVEQETLILVKTGHL